MTIKIIGARLSFPFPKRPPELSRHLGYRATLAIEKQALERMRAFHVCGYDPQMLLPDLRSPAKRMIDEIYGTNYYPYLADLFPRDIGDETITFFEPKMPLAEVFAAEMTAVVNASRGRMQIVFVNPDLVPTTLIRRAEITDFDAIDEILDLKNHLVEQTKRAVGVAFDQIAKDVVTGRHRSYLDHDPTKNTRRRRRK